jgi:type I restriction enzyme M protein
VSPDTFAWTNLPAQLLKGLARDLQLSSSDAAGALGAEYGARPNEDFVAEAWEALRERWLARDPKALAAVVDALWRPSQRDGYRRPSTGKDKLAWLRKRNNAGRLREVVLSEFIAAGEGPVEPIASRRTGSRFVAIEVTPEPAGSTGGAPAQERSLTSKEEASRSGFRQKSRQSQGRATVPEESIRNHGAFIWSVADLLRGDYKQSEYGRVILPLTVLRRLDCVLEGTKAKVLERAERLKGRVENIEPVLCSITGHDFYNTSPLDLRKVLNDPSQVAGNLRGYIAGFSQAARDILDKFEFDGQITRLDKADLLYLVVSKFADLDLHPATVSNLEMGYLYEELVRRFSELSNETAGEHFTPREVIRLMVNLLFAEDDRALSEPGVVRTLFDPACGTGGMLSVAEDHLRQLNPGARLETFGEELNAETYAVCKSDLIIKGQDASHVVCGNSFSEDGFHGQNFDYMLANPPFGVEWKKVEDTVRKEYEKLGFGGRFGAGLPRINDGSFLFLQHMISKMKPAEEGGSRLAIVFNGSPLFTGAPGSGESEIRRWIIENDWLEAVVALPDQLFYNTGISTYFWVVTNRKAWHRQGKVQLVDARNFWVKMRKSLGDKRKEISLGQIEQITRLYADFAEGEKVKILPNSAFGFQRITVERPLRLRWEISQDTLDQVTGSKEWLRVTGEEREEVAARLRELLGSMSTDVEAFQRKLGPLPKAIEKTVTDALAVRDQDAPVVASRKGEREADPALRDNENVPLPATPVQWDADPTNRLASVEYRSAVDDYISAEVLPYVPDAWVDHDKTKIGYEVPLTRLFYKYAPPRPLAEIDAEIKALEVEIQELLQEVTNEHDFQ